MGEVDIAKEHPNVVRMKILGANVIPATHGLKTLKEAVDSAFDSYVPQADKAIYCIGSVVGPHPFPMMVRDFQSVVGHEAKEQFFEHENNLPDAVVACVGGGSNAMGIFAGFIDDKEVELHGVEPMGRGEKLGEHAATLTYGEEGVMHGFNSIMLKDENGEPAPVYSIGSGIDYPSVGPEHAYLQSIGRTTVGLCNDEEAVDAFYKLSQLEGIIPALESAHAVGYAMKLAKTLGKDKTILINLSGRGDKDIDFVVDNYPIPNAKF
jgi:tryptophan synthase beta chain